VCVCVCVCVYSVYIQLSLQEAKAVAGAAIHVLLPLMILAHIDMLMACLHAVLSSAKDKVLDICKKITVI
jgi:hypothetical protein